MTRLPAPLQDAVDKLTADGIHITCQPADGGVIYVHVYRSPYDPGRTRAVVLCALLPHSPTVHVN